MTYLHGNEQQPIVPPSIVSCHLLPWSLLPQIVMTLFTQSTDVLHKDLNEKQKNRLCLIQFVSKVATRIPRVFHTRRNPRVFQIFVYHVDNHSVAAGSYISRTSI